MQANGTNFLEKYNLHTSRFLVFVVFGIFVILRYLAQFEIFANIVVSFITLSPFLLIFFFALWMFLKDKKDHAVYQLMQQKDAFLWIFFKVSLALLVLFMIFFPETWHPAVMLLAFIPKFLSKLQMDDYFLLASYVGILAVSLSSIFFLIRLYQKSQGTYQHSLHRLFKKILYGTFCLLFFLFAFSAYAYPQAYAPVENILADAMVQVVGQSTPGTNINPVLSYMQKISKDVKSNAEDNALKNSVQAGKITQSEADLIQQNRELAKTASELDKASSQLNNQADKLNRTNADLDSQSSLLGSLGQALTDTKDNLVSQISGTTSDLSVSLSASTASLTQSIADTSATLSSEISSKLASTGGTVSGDLIVSGNLAPTGGITFATAQTFNTATLTELGFVHGVTSNIQNQLDGKQAVLAEGTDYLNKTHLDAAYAPISVVNYSLPTASVSVLGGVKIGSRLSIADGVISADVQTTDISGKLDISSTTYALLAGRTGGQTLKGGSAVTDILKLQGTSGNGTLTSPAIQALVGNNGGTVAMTILNNGNVGIGTTSPAVMLSLYGSNNAMRFSYDTVNYATLSANSTGELQIKGASVYDASLTLGGNNANNVALIFDNNSNANDFYTGVDNNDSGKFKIGLLNNPAFLTINPTSGFVGIGTTTPSALLSVGASSQFQVNATGQATATDGFIHKVNADICDDSLFTTDTDGQICLASSAVGAERMYFRTGNTWSFISKSGGFQIPNYEVAPANQLSKNVLKNITANELTHFQNYLTQQITPGELLIPYADTVLGDGAIHGLYARFADVKTQMFGTEISQIENLNLQISANVTTTEELKNAINTQLGSIEKSLATITNDQDTITTQISNINSQDSAQTQSIASLQTLTDILQQQITTLQSQIATTVNIAQLDLNTTSIDYLNQLLGITPDSVAGDIAIVGKLTAKTTATGQLIIVVNDLAAATIGEATIPAGATAVTVSTTAVSADSKVFVTIKSRITAEATLMVTDVIDQKSFAVELVKPLTEDAQLNWWIVESK